MSARAGLKTEAPCCFEKVNRMNENLKIALLRIGLPQYAIAQSLGWSESRLSRIVSGRVRPTSQEQDSVAEQLGVPRDQLFSDDSGAQLPTGRADADA